MSAIELESVADWSNYSIVPGTYLWGNRELGPMIGTIDKTTAIDFNIGDSLVTPNTNTIAVVMPTTGAASAHLGNGHLSANSWQVTLQPQP